MMISKAKKVIAFLIVFLLTFPSQFSMGLVFGEENTSFLTGVHIEDDKSMNLSGQKINANSKISIVYTYEVLGVEDDLLTPMIPDLIEKLPELEQDKGTERPKEEVPPDEEKPEEEVPPDEEKAEEEVPPGEEKVEEEVPPSEEKAEEEVSPSEEKAEEEVPPSEEKAEEEVPPSIEKPEEEIPNEEKPNETENEDAKINSKSMALNFISRGFGTVAYAASTSVYTVNIPDEFDLSKTPDFTVYDEDGNVVGNGAIDDSNHKATITFTTDKTTKGEFCIETRFNSGIVNLEGAREITFDMGTEDPIVISVDIAQPVVTLATGTAPLNFLTSAELLNKEGSPFGEDVKVTDAVNMEYKYQIPASGGIRAGIKYTFQIPDKIAIKDVEKRDFQIIDRSNGNLIVANGRVQDDSSAYIEFTAEAASEKYLDPGIKGTFFVEAGFNGEKVKNGGLQRIEFKDGENKTVGASDVDFILYQIKGNVDLEKTGKENLATRKITWNIIATPTMENAWDGDKVIKKFTVTDKITDPNLTYVSGNDKVVDENGNLVVGGSFLYASNTLTYTFPSNLSIQSGKKYTITFDTKFDLGAWSGGADTVNFTNKAEATFDYPQYKKDPNTGSLIPDVDKNDISNPKEVSKTISVSGGFLDKKGALAAGAQEINWTVTLNKEGFTIPNAQILDTIKLSDGSIPKNVTIKDIKVFNAKKVDNEIVADGVGRSVVNETSVMNELKYTLGEISTPMIITYTSTVDEIYWKDNKVSNFVNKVDFTEGSTPGVGMSVSKSATVPVGSHLVTKSGLFDKKDHTITWTINLNKENLTLEDAKIIDAIPDGLSYVPGSIMSDGIEIIVLKGETYEGQVYANGAIVVDYGADISRAKTISFQTTIDEPEYWAVNYEGEPFTNTATLKTNNMQDRAYTVSATPWIASTVLDKNGIGYDVTTKQVTWEIKVNQNEMEMTGTTITDQIPEYQKFVEGSIGAVPEGAVESYTYDETNRVLEIKLSDMVKGSNPPVITFKTELINLSGLGNNDTETNVKNTAVLTCDQMEGLEETEDASQKIAKSLVEKSGSLIEKENLILWKVTINKNLIPIANAELVDELPIGLALKESSVELYKLTLNPDGTEAASEKIGIKPESIKYENGIFTFCFDELIKDAYRLEFKTFFENEGDYKNAIRFAGGDISLSDDSNVVKAAFSSAGGSTERPQKGTIEVKKVDDYGEPVEGAVFRLGISETQTTGVDGIAKFDGLWPDSYDVVEVSAPEQYIPDSTLYKVILHSGETKTLDIVNKKIKGNLEVIKKDIDSNPVKFLQGAEISLYKKENGEHFVNKQITDINGKALFSNLEFGDYIAKETAPPLGYVNSNQTYEFDINANSDEKTWTWHLENSKVAGNLVVYKTDEATGKALAGAKITVTKTVDTDIQYTVETDGSGKAQFTDLKYGDYVVEETEAPLGYMKSDEKFHFTINNANNGETQTWQIENSEIIGSMKVVKKDAETGETLAGAKITLINNDKPNVQYTEETDSNGEILFADLKYGNYSVEETEAPLGYVKSDEKHEFTIDSSNNGEMQTWNIENSKIIGSLSIKKTDSRTGAVLAGARIALFLSDGTLVDEKVTALDGIISFDNLVYGQYYYTETVAPTGYIMNNSKYYFNIEQNEVTVEKLLENIKRSSSGSGGSGGGNSGGNGNGNNGGGSIEDEKENNNKPPEIPEIPEISEFPEIMPDTVPENIEEEKEPSIVDEDNKKNETLEQIENKKEGTLEIQERSTVIITSEPVNGTVSVDKNGKWTYIPALGFTGTDSFGVTVINADGTEEYIIVDVDVPLGNMVLGSTEEVSDLLGVSDVLSDAELLPKTGESSRLPLYVLGTVLILLGFAVRKRCK